MRLKAFGLSFRKTATPISFLGKTSWFFTRRSRASGLKWLCGDQRDENGKLTRELGCRKGKLVKLHRANGMLTAFYEEETGMLWNGKVSISAEDRI